MITCWPSVLPSPAPTIRPIVSTGPPAAYGTTIVTGRVGQLCAAAGAVEAASIAAAIIIPMIGMVPSFAARGPGAKTQDARQPSAPTLRQQPRTSAHPAAARRPTLSQLLVCTK
jgi:hypothetical protein